MMQKKDCVLWFRFGDNTSVNRQRQARIERQQTEKNIVTLFLGLDHLLKVIPLGQFVENYLVYVVNIIIL